MGYDRQDWVRDYRGESYGSAPILGGGMEVFDMVWALGLDRVGGESVGNGS